MCMFHLWKETIERCDPPYHNACILNKELIQSERKGKRQGRAVVPIYGSYNERKTINSPSYFAAGPPTPVCSLSKGRRPPASRSQPLPPSFPGSFPRRRLLPRRQPARGCLAPVAAAAGCSAAVAPRWASGPAAAPSCSRLLPASARNRPPSQASASAACPGRRDTCGQHRRLASSMMVAGQGMMHQCWIPEVRLAR